MRLQDAQVIEAEGSEPVYALGAGRNEQNVVWRVSDFTCTVHDRFTPGCDACNLAVFEPEHGTAAAALKSRGIVIEP
jgi:hypothetical protein